MANTLITPSIIAKEALFHLENNLIMGDKVHRQYKKEFVKIGKDILTGEKRESIIDPEEELFDNWSRLEECFTKGLEEAIALEKVSYFASRKAVERGTIS